MVYVALMLVLKMVNIRHPEVRTIDFLSSFSFSAEPFFVVCGAVYTMDNTLKLRIQIVQLY